MKAPWAAEFYVYESNPEIKTILPEVITFVIGIGADLFDGKPHDGYKGLKGIFLCGPTGTEKRLARTISSLCNTGF